MVATAEQVVDQISHSSSYLATWLADIRLTLGLGEQDEIMIMIKGLQRYYSKTKALDNREFTAAARAGVAGGQVGVKALSTRPSKEMIEKDLVKLQVDQGCFLIYGR